MKKKLLSALLALCMLMTLAPMTAFAADTKGSATNPFTTVNEYNNAVKDNGMNGQDVYLTISNTEFNSTSNPFNLTNVQSRANPPKLHLTLTGCTFTGNTSGESAQTGNPSFMYLPNCQELVIDNCTFDAGESGLKYGINWNLIQIQDATVSITNSSFTGKFTKNPLKLNQRNGSDDAATDVKNNGTWTEEEIIPASITSAVIENCTFNCTKDGNTPNNVIQLGSQGKGANDGAAPSTGAFPVTIATGDDAGSSVTVELAYLAAKNDGIKTEVVPVNSIVGKTADTVGTETVLTDASANAVASVGNTKFITLAAAVNAAQDGETVKLLKPYDATSEGTITLHTGEKVTLDLGGNNLTLSRFNLKHGWLTVENGSVSCTGGQAFNVYAGPTATGELYTKFVVAKDVTINAAYGICLFPGSGNAGYSSAIEVYGNIATGGIFVSGNLGNDTSTAGNMVSSNKIPTVTIYDGAVVNNGTEGQGIAMNGLANVTVNGGTISGSEAIGVKRGTLTVNGGTFTSNGAYADPVEANNNGTEATGATISITGTYNYAGAISVTLKGGTFTSKNSPAVYLGHSEKNNALVPYTNGVTLDIQGGTFTSENSQVTPVFVANKATGDASTYTKQVISGGTFKTVDDVAANVNTYLVTGVQQDENGTIVPKNDSVAKIDSVGYTTLQDAINAAKDGETVVLLKDITELSELTTATTSGSDISLLSIIKNITIDGNDHSITITMPENAANRSQAISVGSDNNRGIAVTLDDVDLTINGKSTETDKGDAFDIWATLNITNGSNVTLNSVANGFVMQGGMDAKVNVSVSSKVKADGVSGHFSNGGVWTITNSTVDIDNCGTHGLSVEKVKIDNSNVTVSKAGYTGLYGTSIELVNGTTVTVENCGTSNAFQSSESYKGKGAVQLKAVTGDNGTLTVSNSTLTLSGNGNGANSNEQSIYIGNGTLDSKNNATINGTPVYAAVVNDSYRIIYTVNGQPYYTITATDVNGAITYTAPDDPSVSNYTFTGWNYGNYTVNVTAGTATITVSGDAPADNTYTFTANLSYTGGGGGGGGSTPTYAVTLPTDVANGKLSVSPKNAAKGATVTLTVTPDEGYQLDTLTVTDKDGKAVELTKKSDTQYTFKMPASKVSVQASFAPVETPPATLPFTDVDGHWALDAITYVYENGMMNGTSPTTFSPESQLTRGMIVTILYRLEDEPAVSDSTFSDVDGDMYYADPIAWAADNGIVTGFPDGTFGPETSITREQLATILYRYADYLDCDMTPAADLSGYTDAGTISSYAQQAMAWANAEGLITGVTETTLRPTGTATRAQVATILMRFCENVIK